MSLHRGDVPKVFWTAEMHRLHVQEAKDMVALSYQHPERIDRASWEATVAFRTEEAVRVGAMELERASCPENAPQGHSENSGGSGAGVGR